MRHRRGTPGLTPYRLRTIEPGYPRRRRPARHLRAARHISGSRMAMGVAGAIALALLIAGGYQAAAGAVVVLGMF
jgi:uncharacterized membrane protein YccC